MSAGLYSDSSFEEIIGKIAIDVCWEWPSTANTNGNALTFRRVNKK